MIFDSPLSVRNNNPGNIRQGKDGFKKFGSPQEGLDAMKSDLLVKVSGGSRAMKSKFGEGYTPTLRSVLATWAPPSENDTDAYVAHVAQRAGLSPDHVLSDADIDRIVPAMVEMEGGQEALQHFYGGAAPASAQTEALDFSSGSDALDFSSFSDAADDEPQTKSSAFEALGRQLLQGGTAGFADEASDALAAGAASLITGEPYGKMWDDARAMSQPQLEEDLFAHPGVSILGNIGGGIVTGGAGAARIAANAPKLAKSLQAFAQARPNAAAAGVGAGWGGVSAAGQAEGDVIERADDALGGALFGGVTGPMGYHAARGVADLAKGAGDLFAPAIQKLRGKADDLIPGTGEFKGTFTDPNTGNVFDEAGDMIDSPPVAAAPEVEINPMTLAGIVDDQALARLEQGRTIPLTRGDRTQDVVTQRQEQIALESGSEAMRAARAQQQEAVRQPFFGILGDDMTDNAIDLRDVEQRKAGEVASVLRSQYDSLRGRENAAWRAARESGEGVGIRTSSLQDGLASPVNTFLSENQYRAGDVPQLDKHMQELQEIIGEATGADFRTAADLKKLEAWKTRLNTIIGDTPMDKKATGRILKQVGRIYDDFMTNVADDAIVNGDEKAIQAFKDARVLSKQRFAFEDADSAMARILETRDLSGEQLVNTLFGAEKLVAKGDNGRLVETMLKHAGEDAPRMQQAMKQGVMARVLRRAVTDVADPSNPDRNLVSFAKMRTEVDNLMGKKELFSTLFTNEEQQFFKQLHDDLRLVSSKQKGAINNSSTGAWTADLITGFGKVLNNPLFRATPAVGAVTNGINEAFQKQAAAIVTGKAEKGLDEFILDQIQNIDARPAYYGPISAVSIQPDAVLRVTVRPSDRNLESKEETEE